MLTTAEVCQALRIHRKTLLRWCRDGRFPPASRLGGPKRPVLRWPAETVQEYLRGRQAEQVPA